MKLNNKFVQGELQGLVQKAVWSMLWSRKQITRRLMTEKGYREATLDKVFDHLVKKGWAIKVEGARHTYIVHPDVEK